MDKVFIEGHAVDLSSAIDLSIPLDFRGEQPRFFGAPAASSRPMRVEGFSGDVRSGDSCNVETIELTPHCNGTHTECIGHITSERFFIGDLPPVTLAPSTIVTMEDEGAITAAAILKLLEGVDEKWCRVLIVRTLPNKPDKTTGAGGNFVWFEPEAIAALLQRAVEHLVFDQASIDDPQSDTLPAHHAFWGVDPGNNLTGEEGRHRTVTEMVYVPDAAVDGAYYASISWPRFLTDAAPSRVTVVSA